MATNTRGTVARDLKMQLVHYIRKTITFADNGTEVTVGWIPAGAVIIQPMSGVRISTVFNAGTSNVLDIGAQQGNDDPDEFATDLALGVVAQVALDEATGIYVMTADTQITATPALAGTAATAGEAEVIICYIPDNDG